MNVEVDMKVVTSRVANYFHLLRSEGVPRTEALLFWKGDSPDKPSRFVWDWGNSWDVGCLLLKLGKSQANLGHPSEKWVDCSSMLEKEPTEFADLFRVEDEGSGSSLDLGMKLDGWWLHWRSWVKKMLGDVRSIGHLVLGIGMPVEEKKDWYIKLMPQKSTYFTSPFC